MKIENMTTGELLDLQQSIADDPASKAEEGSFYLHTPEARKKLDKIRLQIAHNMAMNSGLG